MREVSQLAKVKAVLFDLHKTLVYQENRVSEIELSDYLFSRGYEVSPTQLEAAWSWVAFIDYPKYGYRNWRSYLRRIFWRLKVRVDNETLDKIVNAVESKPYKLCPDAADAVRRAKGHGFKTAIVTTIAHFQFEKAIKPIRSCFDFIMTGYEAGCDKSNPKMYKKVLEALHVKPQEAVMIGDDMFVDIALPKRLGIRTILLDRERSCDGKLVDAFVYDLREAVEMVINRLDKT
jgi:HAD superfamily hydrolase (TIGR01549 family)